MVEVDFRLKMLPSDSYYGSREWANSVLRLAIQELKNKDRVLSARQLEVFYFLGELESYGFVWQARRLRNHVHLAIKKGFLQSLGREIDPPKKGVGGSS